MGTGLEMNVTRRTLSGLGLCLALLSACGNDSQSLENRAAAKVVRDFATGLVNRRAGPAPAIDYAAVRAALLESGQPVYSVKIDKLHYRDFMAPYGENGPIQTWASNTYESVSMNDGIVVATRGFGPDIMSATVPALGQVSSAKGFFHRVYYYLDGADQPQRVDFDCNFAAAGSDTVTVLDQTYVTRRVTESCANPQSSFENSYWFDTSGRLRQSLQFVSEQVASMQLQRVID